MTKANFVYTTYIKSTPEKVWAAITNPEFTRQYWKYDNISDWRKGSAWNHVNGENGQTLVGGKVLESNPPKKLVLTWVDPSNESDVSQVSFDIDMTDGGIVCLN